MVHDHQTKTETVSVWCHKKSEQQPTGKSFKLVINNPLLLSFANFQSPFFYKFLSKFTPTLVSFWILQNPSPLLFLPPQSSLYYYTYLILLLPQLQLFFLFFANDGRHWFSYSCLTSSPPSLSHSVPFLFFLNFFCNFYVFFLLAQSLLLLPPTHAILPLFIFHL